MLVSIIYFHTLFEIPHSISLHWATSAAYNKFWKILFSSLFCYKYFLIFLFMAS